ncbi:hypothetical protein QBC47DRAFT_371094 [Echria macrotheca]|uniref:CENP-V/GFA domain-containing protein n=1 Tax=Echria macrotheca TaxID=438768 RepID=A0AAJ0BLL3_9PEZI|nr:hypothetical protein QBC47DRAFT_371094 [Echria macrotheca]
MTPTLSCHCGRVTLTLPSLPPYINECHCTVCYKYGVLWGYFPRRDVDIKMSDGATLQKYVRTDEGSDGDISFNRCSHCGCIVCWFGETVPKGGFDGPEKMGVNCRMAAEGTLDGVELRVSRQPPKRS